MTGLIKGAFTLMMAAVAATTIFFIFFGFEPTGWKGAMYFAAESIENTMAEYTYLYSVSPTLHRTDDVDACLGGTLKDVNTTPTNLYDTSVETVEFADAVGYGGTAGTLWHWTSGWH